MSTDWLPVVLAPILSGCLLVSHYARRFTSSTLPDGPEPPVG